MRRFLQSIPVAILAVACALPGCGQKRGITDTAEQHAPLEPTTHWDDGSPRTNASSERPDRSGAGGQGRAINWPFRPESMRLHPLTHALRGEEAASIIEARLEFFDRFGDTTKGLALVRFELSAGEGGRRLAEWEIDVRAVETSMDHYDDVTRTYLFRLGLEGVESLPDEAHLKVTATFGEQRMNDGLTLALR